MPAYAPAYSKDEELGKRDDDFRPRSRAASPNISTLLRPWRWRKRRLLAIFVGIYLLYLFVKNIPTDLKPTDRRTGLQFGLGTVPLSDRATRELIRPPPPRPNRAAESDTHYYDGTVKFQRLKVTLQEVSMGMITRNKNVLFAASSLKSAANLIPMACRMASWKRNDVHLALLGRNSLSLEEILLVNGVDPEGCKVLFHDARPDYSEYSSERRAEIAVMGAMTHVNTYMHPQAIIMDDSTLEDSFFVRGLRAKAREMGRTLIEVPARRYEEFLWMTRLDSGSLANWFKPSYDILIHAPSSGSGGLVRLLKSLLNAEYAGLRVPRLTIELPTDIEQSTLHFLQRIVWPPNADPSPIKQSTLTLRHRIPSAKQTVEQASVRFLESFYPVTSAHDHVVVLSPQTELNPLFLQYLHYLTLEYRYSSYGKEGADTLMGVAMDVPVNFLNGTEGFLPPMMSDMRSPKYQESDKIDQSSPAHFLYQSPSATSSLIFGDQWATLHDFITNRLVATRSNLAPKSVKLVSETEPAWLEYLLELMRLRGWRTFVPAVPFATIHNELAQIPEEFIRQPSASAVETTRHSDRIKDEPFLTAPEPPTIMEHVERESEVTEPLLALLPLDAELPELSSLPYLSHTGALLSTSQAEVSKELYLTIFRGNVGGCTAADATRKRTARHLRTDDLFCLPGWELQADAEEEARDADVAKAIADDLASAITDGDLVVTSDGAMEKATKSAQLELTDSVSALTLATQTMKADVLGPVIP